MQTIAKETKEIVLEHVTHVSCDRCGKTVENSGKPADVIAIQMIHDFTVRFNYGSEFDNDTWHFDICEECLLDYVATFRHAPQGFREIEGETFDDWKRKRLAKEKEEDEKMPEKLTQSELEAIAKRAEVATEGPWKWDGEERGLWNDDQNVACVVSIKGETWFDMSETDADFIAHAREDIPRLLAEIRRLKTIVNNVREEAYDGFYYRSGSAKEQDAYGSILDVLRKYREI